MDKRKKTFKNVGNPGIFGFLLTWPSTNAKSTGLIAQAFYDYLVSRVDINYAIIKAWKSQTFSGF